MEMGIERVGVLASETFGGVRGFSQVDRPKWGFT
jgi:hypothetical protein